MTEEQRKQSSAVTAILEKLSAIDEKLRTLILITEDNSTAHSDESAAEREEPTQRTETTILPAEFAADYEVRGNAYFLKEKLPPEQWNKHYAWFTEHGFAWSPKQMLWWKPKEKRE